MMDLINRFNRPLLEWFDQHGRKNFPWQNPRTAYRVWVSEIMLQQTQVQTVIPYFERFMESFPDIHHLHAASEDRVLAHWSGLGYYSRARNIYKTAKILCDKYDGQFPQDLNELIQLPGIGASTAAAIASQAFDLPTAILDGNVKRVLTRYFLIDGWPGKSAVNKKLWELAQACMPDNRCADYTQAIMDLGATCCTRAKPNCLQCPLQNTCLANMHQKVTLYPFKKLKKALPTKHQLFLLLHDQQNAIYLEKRPPVGIWGGLWCLPSIELNEDLYEFIERKYQFRCINVNNLLELKHTFSHFHLYIKAVSIKVEPVTTQLCEDSGWFHQSGFNDLGLAKPVSQIISKFLIDNELSLSAKN